MSKHKGKDFSGQRITLDGSTYEECNFSNAQLTYKGGEPPEILRCDMSGASIQFGDAAERTALFMVALSKDPALRGFIQQLFPDVKR